MTPDDVFRLAGPRSASHLTAMLKPLARPAMCTPLRDDADAPGNTGALETVGKGMNVSELQWDEIDRRAVDTALT